MTVNVRLRGSVGEEEKHSRSVVGRPSYRHEATDTSRGSPLFRPYGREDFRVKVSTFRSGGDLRS